MNATGCALLRHAVRTRWIGDLLAAYCHTCGHLFVPPAPRSEQASADPSGSNPARPRRPEAVLSPLGGG